LQKLTKKFPQLKPQVDDLINDSYKPTLKAISYSFDTSQDPPQITLFSHAPIGLETIKALAAQYAVPYKDETLKDFFQTIDEINRRFAFDLQHDFVTLNQDFDPEVLKTYGLGGSVIKPKQPLLRTAWNRGENDPLLKDETNFLAPPNSSYQIRNIMHGH